MAEYPRSVQELQQAEAAFALLGLSTRDNVFFPQQLHQSPPIRKSSYFQRLKTCETCLGQYIQRKNAELYHVKCVEARLGKESSASMHKVTICGTFTDFISAKAATSDVLKQSRTQFSSYECKNEFLDISKWPHSDDVYVRAVTQIGEILTISIDVEPNSSELIGNAHGEVCSILYHAIQQIARTGDEHEIRIEGTYRTRIAAKKCAERALLRTQGSPDQFRNYENFSDGRESSCGDNAFARAVSPNGDVFLLSVIEVERDNIACGGPMNAPGTFPLPV